MKQLSSYTDVSVLYYLQSLLLLSNASKPISKTFIQMIRLRTKKKEKYRKEKSLNDLVRISIIKEPKKIRSLSESKRISFKVFSRILLQKKIFFSLYFFYSEAEDKKNK